jgi:hypothetical protein
MPFKSRMRSRANVLGRAAMISGENIQISYSELKWRTKQIAAYPNSRSWNMQIGGSTVWST